MDVDDPREQHQQQTVLKETVIVPRTDSKEEGVKTAIFLASALLGEVYLNPVQIASMLYAISEEEDSPTEAEAGNQAVPNLMGYIARYYPEDETLQRIIASKRAGRGEFRWTCSEGREYVWN